MSIEDARNKSSVANKQVQESTEKLKIAENSFIRNVNILAQNLELLKTIQGNLDQAVVDAQQAVTDAQQAVTDAEAQVELAKLEVIACEKQVELAKQYAIDCEQYLISIQMLIATEATETQLGTVRLASEDDLRLLSPDKVVTAEKLTELYSRTTPSTQANTGIVRYATKEEVLSNIPDAALSPATAKYLHVDLDVTDYFVVDKNKEDISYVLTKLGTNTILDIFGKFSTEDLNTMFTITFPLPVILDTLGFSGSVLGNQGVAVKINSISQYHMSVFIADATNTVTFGDGKFNIKALVDITLIPSAPINVVSVAVGNDVTISWDVI